MIDALIATGSAKIGDRFVVRGSSGRQSCEIAERIIIRELPSFSRPCRWLAWAHIRCPSADVPEATKDSASTSLGPRRET